MRAAYIVTVVEIMEIEQKKIEFCPDFHHNASNVSITKSENDMG